MSRKLTILFIVLFASSVCLRAYGQQQDENTVPRANRTGMFHTIEFSLVEGYSEISESTSFSIQAINGYRFHERYAAGIGIGLDAYELLHMIPVYLRMITNLPTEKNTPFLFFDGGYGFALKSGEPSGINYEDVEGGWMVQPGIGYMFAINNMSLNLQIGYKIQDSYTSYTYENQWGSPQLSVLEEERTRKRFTFGMSLTF